MKVISGNKDVVLKPSCTVKIDNTIDRFEEFVVVGVEKNGELTIVYNADALLLGMSVNEVSDAFYSLYRDLPIETQKDIREAITNDYNT